jgi:long-chain acyl-CoA synthetase
MTLPARPPDVGERISAVMSIDPSVPAVNYRGSWWTWADLASHASRVDAALPSDLAGAPGLAVTVVMRNRPAHVATILGSLARHRCIVPVSSIQRPARLAADVASLRSPVVLADVEDWAHTELVDAVRETGAVGLGFHGREVVEVVAGSTCQAGNEAGAAILMPTSGTTGAPKRVPITYRDLAIGFDRVRRYAKGNEKAAGAPRLSGGVAVSATPLVHIAGMWGVLQFAVEGRRLALLDRFEPHAWADLVGEHRPVFTMLPPTALVMLLDAGVDPARLASLKAIQCATAPLSPEVEQRFTEHFGVPVLTAYGATEFPGGLVGWTLDDKRALGAAKRGSVGRARPGVEIRVVNPDDGAPEPPGAEGLVEAKTPQTVARGAGGWVRTTDLGRMDEDAFLWITGRADGAINRGGFKIHPEAVEAVLTEHPAVRVAGVVGLPDARLGQVPVAAVEVREPVDTDELLTWLRERLLSYQVPTRIEIMDRLPATPSMKVSRADLSALLSERLRDERAGGDRA